MLSDTRPLPLFDVLLRVEFIGGENYETNSAHEKQPRKATGPR